MANTIVFIILQLTVPCATINIRISSTFLIDPVVVACKDVIPGNRSFFRTAFSLKGACNANARKSTEEEMD
jgi:hypothetical protein